jgi:hypothetical protein
LHDGVLAMKISTDAIIAFTANTDDANGGMNFSGLGGTFGVTSAGNLVHIVGNPVAGFKVIKITKGNFVSVASPRTNWVVAVGPEGASAFKYNGSTWQNVSSIITPVGTGSYYFVERIKNNRNFFGVDLVDTKNAVYHVWNDMSGTQTDTFIWSPEIALPAQANPIVAVESKMGDNLNILFRNGSYLCLSRGSGADWRSEGTGHTLYNLQLGASLYSSTAVNTLLSFITVTNGKQITFQLVDSSGTQRQEFSCGSLRPRSEIYRELLDQACALLPDPGNRRVARLSAGHTVDPGISKSLVDAGVNHHNGMWEANAKPWLGMPEFPFFSSMLDCRKPNQSDGGKLVAQQWDFCASWRFLGPVSWHFGASKGDWNKTHEYLLQGINEFRLAAQVSGHPFFAFPLYDGMTREWLRYCAPDLGWNGEPMFNFVESYIKFMVFSAPKTYKLVYARALDITDYYMRHFKQTPRTVLSSRTDDFSYDSGWTFQNNPIQSGHPDPEKDFMKTKSVLDWNTNVRQIYDYRVGGKRYFKDPLSYEFILVEDQHRQLRFERECAQPIWWFEYTNQEADMTAAGSVIHDFNIPSVSNIKRNGWNLESDGTLRMTLTMDTKATFRNYAIALWGLPQAIAKNPNPKRINTNANQFILVKNRLGEYHLVLFFDLVPDGELDIVINTNSNGP